jgi:arylsulfatase A-like enzyme
MNSGCFTNLHEPQPNSPTFVSQFRRAGYRTMAVGKTHMQIHAYDGDYTSDAHRAYMDGLGWDDVCEISANGMHRTGIVCAYSKFLREKGAFKDVTGFYNQWGYFMDVGRKADHSFMHHEFPFDEELKECSFVGGRAVDWIKARGRDAGAAKKPFLLHVGFGGPHSPIEPLKRFMDLYRGLPEPAPIDWPDVPQYVQDGRRGYRAMISEIDSWVGKIRQAIEEQGQLDNTIFVYSADHGEMAGDHRQFDKCSFYEGSAHVPLIFSGPGVQTGGPSPALVEVLDVGRTLCDLAAVPPHERDQGRSLAPVLSGKSDEHRSTVFVELGCDRMLFDGRYKLIWGDPISDTRKLGRLHLNKPVNIPHSPARLYDLREDPDELHDLAGDARSRGLMTAMMEKLLDRISENLQTQPFKSRGEYRPIRD